MISVVVVVIFVGRGAGLFLFAFWFVFAFLVCSFGVISKKISTKKNIKEIFPMFSSRIFIVLSLMSLMHFKLIFTNDIR